MTSRDLGRWAERTPLPIAPRLTMAERLVDDWAFNAGPREVRFERTSLAGVEGVHLKHAHTVRASVIVKALRDKRLVAAGGFRLVGAYILGPLQLADVTIRYPLAFERCQFDERIDLTRASLSELDISSCDTRAILADRLRTENNLRIVHSEVSGEVRLVGAQVNGEVDFRGTKLNCRDSIALNCETLHVSHAMYCDRGFRSLGAVRLRGAYIGGGLGLGGAQIDNMDGPALSAESITVADSIHCNENFRATGSIELQGAKIGGDLLFTDARLHGSGYAAVDASDVTVGRVVRCDGEFCADGEIRFVESRIGGQLILHGATLLGTATSLDASQAQVAGIYCDESLHATGTLTFAAAKIDDVLQLAGEVPALVLIDTSVRILDDTQFSWEGNYAIDGLSYDRLVDRSMRTHRWRINEWLARQRVRIQHPSGGTVWELRYSPQPYEELASAFVRRGWNEEARAVLIAKHRHRLRRRTTGSGIRHLPLTHQFFQRTLGRLVGFGYRPGRAILPMVVVVAVGVFLFGAAYARGGMIALADTPQDFNAMVYAADAAVPLIDLGQETSWAPRHDVACGADMLRYACGPIPLAWYWVSVVVGWLAITAFVAGYTGAFKST